MSSKSTASPSAAAPDPSFRLAFAASGVVVAVCFIGMLWLSWLRWPDILIDFGEELYVPWRLLEGDVLYRDLFFARGPFSPYVNAAVFGVFGVDFLALALFNVVVIAGICALLYAIHLREDRVGSATLVVVVFLLMFAFAQYIGVGNYNFVTPYSHEQTHGPALALLGIWALRRYLLVGGLGWLAGIGGVAGCAFLTKPEIFIAYAAAMGAAGMALGLATGWRRSDDGRGVLAEAGAVALGFAAPIVLFAALVPAPHSNLPSTWPVLHGWSALLAIGGAATADPLTQQVLGFDRPWVNLGRMGVQLAACLAIFGAFLAVNHLARVVSQQRIVGAVLFACLLACLLALFEFPASWIGLLRALPALLVLYILAQLYVLLRSDAEESGLADRIPILALSIFALAMIGRMVLRARAHHYGFSFAMPGTVVVVEGLVCAGALVARRLSGRSTVYTGLALALVVVFLLAHVEQSRGYLSLKTAMVGDTFESYGPEFDPRSPIVNGAIDWIEANTAPTDTIVVLPEGVMLNFLTRRASPVRFITFNPVLLEIYEEQEIVQALRWDPPDYVVFVERDNTEHGARYFGVDYARALFDWIDRRYVIATQFGATPFTSRGFGIRIMQSRSGGVRGGERGGAAEPWTLRGRD